MARRHLRGARLGRTWIAPRKTIVAARRSRGPNNSRMKKPFTRRGAEIRALYMEYDPKTHWLLARGTERELVDFNIASQPGGPKLAEEVYYNLDTGQVKSSKLMVSMGR